MKTLSRRSHIIRAFACVMMLAMVLTAVNVPAVSAKKTVAGKTIKLNKKKATITEGDTLTLKATVKPKKATVTWKTSNKKVATVKNGKVTAKKAGKADITASIKTAAGKTKKAVCKVTVEKKTEDPDASTDPNASTAPDASAAPVAPTPVPPAADVAALDAAKPLEQREYNLPASMYINTAGGTVLSAAATVNGAGTYTLTGTVAAGTADKTDMTAFTVDTGIPIASVVYKITDIKLTKKGKDLAAASGAYTVSENAGGTWEINLLRELSGFNTKVTADEAVSVQYTVVAQTPEESAASLAKALKKIPLRAGGTNNVIEAKIKVSNIPAGGAQVGMSFGLNNSWADPNSSTGFSSDSSFLKLSDGNVVVGDTTDTNPAEGKVHTFTTEGEEFTYTMAGLHDSSDIESLQFQSNVSNKDENFVIEIVYIKVNGHELSILGTPRGTEADKTHYMCDFDSNGTFAACGRNIYGGYTAAAGNTANQLSWFWEGTTVKADGTSANNISRTALY